ncbi:MAG TPA: DUF2085 domain-containing protein [Polyangiaceae bacterium]
MKRDPRARALRVLLVTAAAFPLVPRLTRDIPGLSLLGELTLAWFGIQCQRDPTRALALFGESLPVCARCTGIYLGFGLGALLLRPRLAPAWLRAWVALAGALILLDVLSEAFSLRPAWAPLRVLSGALLSYPVGGALVRAARERWPCVPTSVDSKTVHDADRRLDHGP